jgi:hypothetical protein
MVFKTHFIQIVEIVPLPNRGGLQILWRNPPGYHPKSGEFVKIRLPWLKHGGKEWHPFSIYLKESTQSGWDSVHRGAKYDLGLDRHFDYSSPSHYQEDNDAENGGSGSSYPSLEDFIENVLSEEDFETDVIKEEARISIDERYDTTQIFIVGAGEKFVVCLVSFFLI